MRASVRASSRRLRSPPDSDPTGLSTWSKIEQEVLQIADHMAGPAAHEHGIAAFRAEGALERGVEVEGRAALVEIGRLQGRGPADLAGIGSQVADQHAQQGRLAGAVGAQYADPVAAQDARAETLNDRPVPVLLGDVLGLYGHAAPDFALFEHDAGALRGPEHGGAALAHVVQRGKPALVAPAPRGDAPMQPARLLGDAAVELLLPAQLLRDHGFRPFLEGREAAPGLAQTAALQPQDAVGHAGQETAVVADGDDGALIAPQQPLQPLDGGEVKMVRRLVQQQDIGSHGQHARKLRPPAFAPRKRCHAPLRVEIQPVHHCRNGVVGHGRSVVRRAAHIVPDQGLGVAGRVLVQIGDADAGLGVAFAQVEFQFACDDLHQGGLAAAIAADQAGPVAARNAEADLGEQARAAEAEFRVAQGEDRRARHRRPSGVEFCSEPHGLPDDAPDRRAVRFFGKRPLAVEDGSRPCDGMLSGRDDDADAGQDLPHMNETPQTAERARRGGHEACDLAPEPDELRLPGHGPGHPVDGVLQERGDGAVIFRRRDQEAVMGKEQFLQPDRAGRQALSGFQVAVIERKVEVGEVQQDRFRAGGLGFARRKPGQPGIEGFPAHRPRKSKQSGAQRRTIFPGFMMFFGSSARLIARIAGKAEGCSASRKCNLP